MLPLLLLLSLLASTSSATDSWQVLSQDIISISMGLEFLTPMVGMLSGSTSNGVCEVKRTTDGGHNWTDVSHEQMMMIYMCMAFPNNQDGVTAGLGMDVHEVSSSYTTDAGLSWSFTDDRNLFAAYQDCESVPGVDGMVVMPGTWEDLIGSSGSGVAVSLNGGRDFKHYNWGIDTEARYAAFGSKTVGWISGGTWPEDSEAVHHVSQHHKIVKDSKGTLKHQFAGKSANVAGYYGVIANTQDGGNTWSIQYSNTSFYFNGIYATDTLNVWAAAEGPAGAYIFHTADGGATWNQQLFVSGASMITVKFLNKNEGWVAGASSLSGENGMHAGFWHTLDGGASWELSTLKNYYVTDMDPLDSAHAYATAFSVRGDTAVLQYVQV